MRFNAKQQSKTQSNAFTLIEVIVVMAVIALLVALLIPAVQSARESARRITCVSQLKNIGIAIHQHHESRGMFPGASGPPLDASYLVQILPFLEQETLYNSFNFSSTKSSTVNNMNGTVMFTRVANFICPSDLDRADADLGSFAASNYAANSGTTDRVNGTGPFVLKPLSAQAMTDGLSQTVGVSEWVVGRGLFKIGDVSEGTRLGSVYSLTGLSSATSIDAFATECENLSSPGVKLATPGFKGLMWVMPGLGATQYNHVLTPNHPSCISPTSAPSAFTAGSYHAAGCNSLMMDGSIHFMKASIAPNIWAAIGTKSGGEPVDQSAY